LYCEQRLTTIEIGKLYGVSSTTVLRRMNEYGIQSRRKSNKYRFILSKDEIERLYWKEEKNIREIAELTGISQESIRYWMKQYGIPTRSIHEAFKIREKKIKHKKYGPKNANWKGGRWISKEGYVYVWIGPNQRKAEHRLIMEQYLGRKLQPNEYVHHLNGIRSDNRIENLAVVSPKEHETFTLKKALQRRIRQLEEELENCRKKLKGEYKI